MKNIAIVFLGDFFYDARSINMALSLQKKYNVYIISTSKNKRRDLLFSKINFISIDLPSKGLLKYWGFYKKTLQALNRLNLCSIIAGDLYSLASSICAKNKKCVIYDCREIYFDLAAHNHRPLRKVFSFYYESFLLKFADKIIVTALSDLHFLQKKHYKHKHLIWNVVHNFPAFLKQQPLKISAPKNNTLIVYQGALQDNRGIKQLIYLSSLMPSVSAVIIGGGGQQQKYIDYAQKLNVLNKTIFINQTYYIDLLNYTCLCDIGWAVIKDVGKSNHFALPNKLFEYGMCDLPTIASPLPNMQKVINKHSLGVIVPESDVKKQIKAVQFLMQNKKPKTFYRDIVNSSFSWALQSKTFLNIVSE